MSLWRASSDAAGVSFFEYLEKIELYYFKKNNSENVFRELFEGVVFSA